MEQEPRTTADIQKRFIAAGFEIDEAGAPRGSFGVKKYNCVHYLELKGEQAWLPLSPPYFIIRGVNYELEDRGYQKFWRHQGTRFAIRKADLETLHRFDEEVREILRLRCLYNESLGTTCARTDYDRLEGRPDR
jgi:hypothetical protein